MLLKVTMADKVVKLDAELYKEVELFLEKKENKYMYINKKQLIDLAVSEYLEKRKKKVKKR